MNYLQDVVLNVEKNQGKLLNLLIESKIVDLELATKEVIKSNDARAIYYFARYIKNADKKVLAKKIISTNPRKKIARRSSFPKLPRLHPINNKFHLLYT